MSLRWLMLERQVAGVTLRVVGGLIEVTLPNGAMKLMNPDEALAFAQDLEARSVDAEFKNITDVM